MRTPQSTIGACAAVLLLLLTPTITAQSTPTGSATPTLALPNPPSISGDIAAIPMCAAPCLSYAVQEAGCAIEDYVCQCSVSGQQVIPQNLQPCLSQVCGTQEIVDLTALYQNLCQLIAQSLASVAATATTTSTTSVRPTSKTSSTTTSTTPTVPPVTYPTFTARSLTSTSTSSSSASVSALGNATITAAGNATVANATVALSSVLASTASPPASTSKSVAAGVRAQAGWLGSVSVAAMLVGGAVLVGWV